MIGDLELKDFGVILLDLKLWIYDLLLSAVVKLELLESELTKDFKFNFNEGFLEPETS